MMTKKEAIQELCEKLNEVHSLWIQTAKNDLAFSEKFKISNSLLRISALAAHLHNLIDSEV